jgi:hypothetical protein
MEFRCRYRDRHAGKFLGDEIAGSHRHPIPGHPIPGHPIPGVQPGDLAELRWVLAKPNSLHRSRVLAIVVSAQLMFGVDASSSMRRPILGVVRAVGAAGVIAHRRSSGPPYFCHGCVTPRELTARVRAPRILGE